jgi:hypothetical protein
MEDANRKERNIKIVKEKKINHLVWSEEEAVHVS